MLGDDIQQALVELRAHAESMMVSAGTVTRVDGTTTDVDGREVPHRTPVYTGTARLVRARTAPDQVLVAGASLTAQQPQLHFPVGAFRMRVGDVWTCTENPPDPTLVGRSYRLIGEAPAASLSVAYRVQVEEIL
jgi:hypothetical protein